MCPPALLAASGDRGHFEYAAALINVNETAGNTQRRAATPAAQISVGIGQRFASGAAPQNRWVATIRQDYLSWQRVDKELGGVGRDHSLLEDEAAVEAPFAGLDHAIRFLGAFIEGKSLDRTHRRRAALRSVDLGLHLNLHGRNLVG